MANDLINGAQSRRYDLEERLLQARVDAQEMQNAVVAGQLISREAVELAIGDIIARARMLMLALPGKIGNEVAAAMGGKPEDAIRILRREIIAVLQVLSRQEGEEADRIMRAVRAGVERGMNGERGDQPTEDERGDAEPSSAGADGEDAPAADRGRGTGISAAGLWATLAAQRSPPSDPAERGKPSRRRGRPVGGTN